jgi:predicted CXXCH cytochrome family protein
MSGWTQQRPRSAFLIGIGLLLCSLGIVLSTSRAAHAQDGEQTTAEYVGVNECSSCHKSLAAGHSNSRHSLALQDVSSEKTAIKADFTSGEKERTVTFPDDSLPRPFTADDIEYIVGSGRYVERYLYRISRGKYAVFPAEWNVQKKVWQPYIRGEGVAKWPDDPAYDWVQNCAGCHTTGLLGRRGRWQDDGVQCEACHGPGSNHVDLANKAGSEPSDSDLADIHKAIVLSPDSQVCGQCHSQGLNADGKLPYPTGYLPGANLLDESVFSLVAKDDKDHWWDTGHARQQNMQFNEWLKSGHSQALATMKGSKEAATPCLECHSGDFRLVKALEDAQKADILKSTPAPLALDSAKFGVECTNCHDPHGSSEADKNEFELVKGNAYALCTSCHRATDVTKSLHHPSQEMFEGLALVKGIPGIPSAHFKDAKGPRCQTCHLPRVPVQSTTSASHVFLPVLPGKAAGKLPDSCSGCHDKLTPTDLQSLIDDTQDAVRARLSVALARLGTVPKPDAGAPSFDAYNQVVMALTFIQNDGSLGVHNYAYVDALFKAAEKTLAELSVPGATINPTEGPAPTATSSVPVVPLHPQTVSVPTGFRPVTALFIGSVVLLLLIGAFIFLRRPKRQEG